MAVYIQSSRGEFFVGRSRRDWTEDKFERYLKEGRGEGSGRNHIPYTMCNLLFRYIRLVD